MRNEVINSYNTQKCDVLSNRTATVYINMSFVSFKFEKFHDEHFTFLCHLFHDEGEDTCFVIV